MLRRLRAAIGELIGRVSTTVTAFSVWRHQATLDWTKVDYTFWDRARRGKAQGLDLSGLFLKPLASKTAAWVMGHPPTWDAENEATAQALNAWWQEHQADIQRAYRESLGLGDCYLVINADLSVTLKSPDVVTPLVASDDYSRIVGWRIRETYPHPAELSRKMTVTDDYYADRRERTIEIEGGAPRTETYRNLIGRLPVVHIPNEPGGNEVFGHPEGEALLSLLHRYGEVFDAAIEGNIRQGRATPAAEFADAEAVEQFFSHYAQQTSQVLPDGTTETNYVIDFDADKFLAIAGKFDWKSPGSFSGDVEAILGLMFYLLLQHTEIPEFVWGNAIASSKASAEAQMPAFVRWVEGKRTAARSWIGEVAATVAAYLALFEPGVRADEDLQVQWEDLTGEDGRLTLDAVTWAFAEGLLDEQTALQMAPLDVPDIQGVLQKARQERAEAEARQHEFEYQDQLEAEIRRLEAARDEQRELMRAA